MAIDDVETMVLRDTQKCGVLYRAAACEDELLRSPEQPLDRLTGASITRRAPGLLYESRTRYRIHRAAILQHARPSVNGVVALYRGNRIIQGQP